MKSRMMRWVGCLAHVREKRMHAGFWLGNVKEGNDLEDLGMNGGMILK
jgi:hypothetical protein